MDTGRRRRWSDAEKLRIVEESYAGHRQASATARRHGISTSLLYRWRRNARAGLLGQAGRAPAFVQATVLETPAVAQRRDNAAGRMEIHLANGRRITVGPDVDADALGRVLEVLEAR
ncbi:IS66-like element accessory protein TnpA [Ferruginivarius sediminum]|uniref:IS66-like element accessory protein TnpA n=1 Tax=Ferruginivarius sediminum TaxID=2661937 RepID=UPI0019D4E3EE|nr:transposase [Ferruginivarius sediminum]